MSHLFLTGLRRGGTSLGGVALLPMVCEKYLAMCVCFIYDNCAWGLGEIMIASSQAAAAGSRGRGALLFVGGGCSLVHLPSISIRP